MRFYILLGLLITIVSCENSAIEEPSEIGINLTVSNADIVIVENEEKDLVETELESRYKYDKEWEVFKEALLNKDIKGVSAFASSDAIDAEALIIVMDNEMFLQKLRETKYEDLEVNDTKLGVSIEFHVIEAGMDSDGNEVGSAITIFFTEGEQFLELDYFIATG
tara:strand:- start:189 stop:683 length:495 start_codon:yes stop_codon:yes gene_type:complete